MTDYSPELGQAVFGQPQKAFEVPEIMDAAMQYIRYELGRVMWNISQEDYSDPFGNTGNSFDCPAFSARAYSWGDDEQPWNFKCGDVEISWYKYMGRGMSSNVGISPQMASDILEKCLAELRKLDDA